MELVELLRYWKIMELDMELVAVSELLRYWKILELGTYIALARCRSFMEPVIYMQLGSMRDFRASLV